MPDDTPTAAGPKEVNPGERPIGAARNVKNNLVALGSAAVLTVYASGYLRTRPAAARFTAEAAQRMPAAAPAVHAGPQVRVTPTPKPARRDATVPHAVPEPVRAADSIPAPAAAPVAVPAAVPSAPSSTAVTAPPADSASQPAKNEQVALKDGVYFGWGTSRHGDIEASVEVEGGRITSAYISRCETRYPCSWISALPPQVVTRQSANVDYVSGATQSTNAFYYAVLEALSKAK
jgi:uncharacterized protein with FMN-binding domain